MKLDILAIGIHPDDVELSCSGTLMKHISEGKTAGVVDLSCGELGTRGSAELRKVEAANAAKIMGLSYRTQLDFKDGFFQNDEAHLRKLITYIRLLQPEIVLANAISDRHPDHGRAAKLIADACFYSGLIKIETTFENKPQAAWRPKAVYHYVQDQYVHPDFVIDVSAQLAKKHESIMAYSSQFFNPNSKEPETPISSKEFLVTLDSKMALWGRSIGVQYAEGFTVNRYPGVRSLFDLI